MPIPQDARATARATPHALATALVLAAMLLLAAAAPSMAASAVTHGSRQKPWVALTFDDGWNIDRCARIAATLRSKHATATFLINGTYMQRAPARWRSVLAGFAVANHSYAHRNLSLLSAAAVRADVAGDEARIERILGRPMLKVLRPPYGAYDSTVSSVAASLGYRLVLWDVDSGDTYAGATTSGVISRASAGGRGSIVLMHCGPSVTPAAVGRVVEAYRSRGLRLVDLGTILGLAPPKPVRPPDACRVRDQRTGAQHRTLRRAAAKARRGDRLVVTGTCAGSTTLKKDLVIVGARIPGSGRPTLDGERKGRVLTVVRGTAVTLRGLLIERGRAPEGGAIRNGGWLRLRDTTVRDSRAQVGAGIDNRPPGVLRLMGTSVVRANQARVRGGGIRNLGTLRGARCGTGGNVRANTPDDCAPAPTPTPEADLQRASEDG